MVWSVVWLAQLKLARPSVTAVEPREILRGARRHMGSRVVELRCSSIHLRLEVLDLAL